MWNEKEVHRLDTGWTMWPWPSISPVTLTFDFSKSNFKISVSQELLSDWCETKRKQVNWILGWMYGLALWLDRWPWPCSFKAKVWNSLICGMGWLIDMGLKGCESIIHHHGCDPWVTMVRWVDVPHSDWGDFGRRRAVDISSSFTLSPCSANLLNISKIQSIEFIVNLSTFAWEQNCHRIRIMMENRWWNVPLCSIITG